MKLVFAGTPDFAAQHLTALLEQKFEVIGVYTQPDRPAGRGKKPQASAVKKIALANNIEVYQPENFNHSEQVDTLRQLNADLMVVVAYGIILPKAVLSTPTYGCINVHGSLLPKWRGAAPIQRAIWAGDKQTGVTIMQMDEGLDTGPMLYKAELDITADDTTTSLYERLAKLGPEALINALQRYPSLTPQEQDNDSASYAKKLSKQEAKIDWSLPAIQLERNCRAFNPWPVQWFSLNDTSIKVWASHVGQAANNSGKAGEIIQASKTGIEVATGDGHIVLTQLQLPGKKPMSVADILNSRASWFTPGTQL